MADLVSSMKKAAMEAVEAGRPMTVCFGVVESVQPLRVVVEQKLTLTEKQLLLTRSVTDYDVPVSMSWMSGSALADAMAHSHALSGEKNTSDPYGAEGRRKGHPPADAGRSAVSDSGQMGGDVMALMPESKLIGGTFDVAMYPSQTYGMDWEKGAVRGQADGLAAIRQAVFKALHTERFTYAAYSANYGVELADLVGRPLPYVLPEIKRRITEALTWDSRISSVDGFAFEVDGSRVHCTFTVHSIHGDLQEEVTADV